jgi:AraC-like DNA-binding protein
MDQATGNGMEQPDISLVPPKASLHPEDAIKALEILRVERECNMLDAKQIHKELVGLISQARDARLKWHEIAEASGVSRSYVMRVWKESNGEKT